MTAGLAAEYLSRQASGPLEEEEIMHGQTNVQVYGCGKDRSKKARQQR